MDWGYSYSYVLFSSLWSLGTRKPLEDSQLQHVKPDPTQQIEVSSFWYLWGEPDIDHDNGPRVQNNCGYVCMFVYMYV